MQAIAQESEVTPTQRCVDDVDGRLAQVGAGCDQVLASNWCAVDLLNVGLPGNVATLGRDLCPLACGVCVPNLLDCTVVARLGMSVDLCPVDGALSHDDTCIAMCPDGSILPQRCLNGTIQQPDECCAIGTYWDGTPGSSCVACEAGQVDHDLNPLTACATCALGRFSGMIGVAGSCAGKCPAGTFVDFTWVHIDNQYCDDANVIASYRKAQDAVDACKLDAMCLAVSDGGCDRVGNWKTCRSAIGLRSSRSCMYEKARPNSTTVADCQQCEAGQTDADSDPSTACTNCPPGRFSDVVRSFGNCSGECPAGTYARAGSTSCAECEAGKIDHDNNPETACFTEELLRSSTIPRFVEVTGRLDDPNRVYYLELLSDRMNERPHYATSDRSMYLYWFLEGQGGGNSISRLPRRPKWQLDNNNGLHDDGDMYAYIQSASRTVPLGTQLWWDVPGGSVGPTWVARSNSLFTVRLPSCTADFAAPSGGTLGDCPASGLLDGGSSCLMICADGVSTMPQRCWNGVVQRPDACCVSGTGWDGLSGSSCALCEAGQTDADSNPATPCENCVPGRFSDVVGAIGDCSGECEGGSYSSEGSTACEPCEAGQTDYDYDPATPCSACVRGRFSDAVGSTGTCIECPAGRGSFATGLPTIMSCEETIDCVAMWSPCSTTQCERRLSVGAATGGGSNVCPVATTLPCFDGSCQPAQPFAITAEIDVPTTGVVSTVIFHVMEDGPLVERSDDSQGALLFDATGDGTADDVFVINRGQDNEVLISDGAGGWTRLESGALVERSSSSASTGAVLLDATGDGTADDVLILNYYTRNDVMISDGAGNWTRVLDPDSPTDALRGHGTDSLGAVLFDATGDGTADDVLVLNTPGANEVLLSDGAGGWTHMQRGMQPLLVLRGFPVLLDATGDGSANDLLGSNGVAILNDAGSWTSMRSGPLLGIGGRPVLFDATGDGTADDVLVLHDGANEVFLSDGTGGWSQLEACPLVEGSSSSHDAVLFDATGDGTADDLLVVNIDQANEVYISNGSGGWTRLENGALMEGSLPSRAAVLFDAMGDKTADDVFVLSSVVNEVFVSEGARRWTQLHNGALVERSDDSRSAMLFDATGDGTADDVLVLNAYFARYYNSTSDVVVVVDSGVNEVLISDGVGGWTRLESGALVEGSSNSQGALLFDATGDGTPDDVFVVNIGGANEVFLSDGVGGWTRLESGALVERSDKSYYALLFDATGDGTADDVFVANSDRANEVLISDGVGGWTRLESGALLEGSRHSQSALLFDATGDGTADDLLVLTLDTDPNDVYISDGVGGWSRLESSAFRNSGGRLGSWGALLFDATGDGTADDVLVLSRRGHNEVFTHAACRDGYALAEDTKVCCELTLLPS